MFWGSKARPVCDADNLTAICEPIVYIMWDPQHLATLWASSAYYGDSFTFYLLYVHVEVCVVDIISSAEWEFVKDGDKPV
jgi:hypothetical protein